MTRSWVEVPLTKGRVAKIDRQDMLIIGRWCWMVHQGSKGREYASRSQRSNGKGGTILMHRWIMEPPPGMVVDHINGDTLDNRRVNLRVCTQQQNVANQKVARRRGSKSPYRGVARSCGGRWTARTNIGRVPVSHGTYDTPEEAARVYDRVIRAAFGEFATLNFPDEWPANAAD